MNRLDEHEPRIRRISPAADRRRCPGCFARRLRSRSSSIIASAGATENGCPSRPFSEEFPPPTLDDDELLDLIYNEVVLREEDGESPELDEYLRRFPAVRRRPPRPVRCPPGPPVRPALHARISPAPRSTSRPRARTPTPEKPRPVIHPTSRAPAAGAPRLRPRISTASLTSSDPGWPMLEGYDIQDVLGSGGMGTVFRAYDRERRRPVALKVMNRAGAAAILRFKHEFRTLLGVAHPNLVTLYELISDGQNWFLTMELLDGVNFLQYVRDEAPRRPGRRPGSPGAASAEAQPLTPGQRVRLRAATRQLADGIAWLHAAGKLHRDIKPTNVIVTREGRVVLLDFGLVAEQGSDGRHHSTEEHILGTAAYMAPEQAAGLPVSPATDWYSVGVMLFEALTGRLPFLGGALRGVDGQAEIRAPGAVRAGSRRARGPERLVRRPAPAAAGGSSVGTRRAAPAGQFGSRPRAFLEP